MNKFEQTLFDLDIECTYFEYPNHDVNPVIYIPNLPV